MSKIIRNIGGNNVQDPSAIAAMEFSRSAGSKKVSEVGRHLLAIPYVSGSAIAYTTDASGAVGVQTIGTLADTAGSLAGTFFLLQSQSGNKYAVWFKVSGSGSAPSQVGYTNVEVDITTGATAAQVGTALAPVIAALNSGRDFGAAGTTTVTVTNKTIGTYTAIADGSSPTGFTFGVSAAGSGLSRVLPKKGMNLAIFNSDTAVRAITLKEDAAPPLLAAGVADSDGNVGIPCAPGVWTYIACDSQNWVVSSSALLLIFIIDDETSVKVEASK